MLKTMVNLCVSTNDDIELRIGSKVMSPWSTKSNNTPKIRFGYVMFGSATMKIDAILETKIFHSFILQHFCCVQEINESTSTFGQWARRDKSCNQIF